MNHIDLFSGIGGFALAVDTVWPDSKHIFCEIDPFCQKILSKHWPQSKIYGDIRFFTNTNRTGGGTPESKVDQDRSPRSTKREHTQPESSGFDQCDILTGGFPCQPFSHAGKRRGREDNRFLWPQMLRVIQENQPTWIIAENVGGILTIEGGMVFEQVCSDLEGAGYEVQSFIIPACAVNAPHRRDRVWFIAHSQSVANSGRSKTISRPDGRQMRHDIPESGNTDRILAKDDSNTASERRQRSSAQHPGRSGQPDRHGIDKGWSWDENWAEVAAKLCRMDDGLPARLDGFELSKSAHRTQRLKALGNAIVPQVALEIMKAISLQTQT